MTSFISSPAPEKCAHVRIPDRRIIRWSDAKKEEVFSDNLARRRHQESLRAEKRRAKMSVVLDEMGQSQHEPAPIDPSELRQILSAFEAFLENDHERDELVLLTTRHLQGLPGATPLFQQFTRMLRTRRR